jgi:hypothetical protein
LWDAGARASLIKREFAAAARKNFRRARSYLPDLSGDFGRRIFL